MRTPQKLFKLEPQLPKLSASRDENVEDWFFIIERFAKRAGIPNEKLLDTVSPLIRGNALQIVKNQAREIDGLKNWARFKQTIRELLDLLNQQLKLRVQLKNLQAGSNFNDFVYKFRSIANQIINMPETEIMYVFLEALQPRTKAEVLAKEAKTLKDAIKYASIYEECCHNASQISAINNV